MNDNRYFYLYTENDVNNLFEYLSIYSKEIYKILESHPKRTLNINNATYFITCLSNETNYPEYNKPYIGKAKISLPINQIKNIFKYYNYGNHIIFYHKTPNNLPSQLLNISYCSDSFKSIIIPPPAPYKDLIFNIKNNKYLISFKGSFNRMSFETNIYYRNNIINTLIKYRNNSIIIEESHSLKHNYKDLLENSTFGLVIEGDLPWSYRLTEVINSGAIPIIILPKNYNILPFKELLNYSEFSILLNSEDIDDFFINKLNSINNNKIAQLQSNLQYINNTVFKNRKTHVYTLIKYLTTLKI
tara:strand:- start:539 stop:1441 length:903 start_codon:yes stop_codon:yes gene_type:complete